MNAKFDALEKLKENNWQEEEKKRKKVVKKTKAKVSCISTEIVTKGNWRRIYLQKKPEPLNPCKM